MYTAPHHVIYFSVTSARSCDTRLATTSYNSILEKLFLSRGSTEGEGGEVLVTRGKISILGSTAPPSPHHLLPTLSPWQADQSRERCPGWTSLCLYQQDTPGFLSHRQYMSIFFQKIILFLIYDLRTDNWMIHWVNADIFSCCLLHHPLSGRFVYPKSKNLNI